MDLWMPAKSGQAVQYRSNRSELVGADGPRTMTRPLLLAVLSATLPCAPALAQKIRSPLAGGKSLQDPIARQCVTVSRIRYYAGDSWYPNPGVGGVVTSQCATVALVHITIAYSDKHGKQLGIGVESTELPPGALWKFRHEAYSVIAGGGRIRSGSITDVDVQVLPKKENQE